MNSLSSGSFPELPLLIGVAVLIIILLFLLIRSRKFSGGGRKERRSVEIPAPGISGTAAGSAERERPCPLCQAILKRGERVRTTVFPGEPDQLAHIFGCPYCNPPNSRHKRICPVCKKEVPRDGYVIARMFVRQNRKHVHVLGCTGCRRG